MLSRELIIDACAVINLIAGQTAKECLGNIDPTVQITQAAEGECGQKKTVKTAAELLEAELLTRCPTNIDADELAAFIAEHDLGAGESEAILACSKIERHLWSDDRRARRIGTEKLGQGHVTGTIGILKELVRLGDIEQTSAYDAYAAMRAAGAFLPDMTIDDFKPNEV